MAATAPRTRAALLLRLPPSLLGAELVALAADSVLEEDSEELSVEEAEELDEDLWLVVVVVMVLVLSVLVVVEALELPLDEPVLELLLEEPVDEAELVEAEAVPLAATETAQ